MTSNNKIPDYITFPKTFENYRWYKPLLVFILSFIFVLILRALTIAVFYLIAGPDFIISAFKGGYETLSTPLGLIF